MVLPIEAQVIDSSHLKLKKPIQIPPGSNVVITIMPIQSADQSESVSKYSLRGQPMRYIKPFDSVAEDEWDVR